MFVLLSVIIVMLAMFVLMAWRAPLYIWGMWAIAVAATYQSGFVSQLVFVPENFYDPKMYWGWIPGGGY